MLRRVFSDKAFVDHIKSLYITRGCGVSVRITNAKGKGSNNVVRHAVNIREGYDVRAAFYDTDVELRTVMKTAAKGKKIILIGSEPCLEGLLLNILGEPVPHDSYSCKQAFTRILDPNDPVDRESYAIFTLEVLEERRRAIPVLDKLINTLNGS